MDLVWEFIMEPKYIECVNKSSTQINPKAIPP